MGGEQRRTSTGPKQDWCGVWEENDDTHSLFRYSSGAGAKRQQWSQGVGGGRATPLPLSFCPSPRRNPAISVQPRPLHPPHRLRQRARRRIRAPCRRRARRRRQGASAGDGGRGADATSPRCQPPRRRRPPASKALPALLLLLLPPAPRIPLPGRRPPCPPAPSGAGGKSESGAASAGPAVAAAVAAATGCSGRNAGWFKGSVCCCW